MFTVIDRPFPVTYMYVGFAVRIALAIGINRSPPRTSEKDPEVIKSETRTWWYVSLPSGPYVQGSVADVASGRGLYSLEM